ncbi:MAG: DUF4837 family protein [Bacteroidota bacterium]
MKRIVFLSLLLVFFLACKDKQSDQSSRGSYSASSGNINSLNVVLESDDWNGEIGESIREHFAANVDGLPQQEPLFNLNHIPPQAFSGFGRKNRLFLKIEKGKPSVYKNFTDSFAKPQTGIVVGGKTEQEVIQLLDNHSPEIIKSFKKTEINEQLRRIAKSPKDIQSLKEALGVSLLFPSAYRYAKRDNDFFWMRKDIKNGNMELLVFETPISSIENDNEPIDNIIRIRDSIGKKHIPGPREGQFMETEEAYAPYIDTITFRGRNAFEVKGTWEVKEAFMAGPFLTYAIKDEKNSRYVIAEGFVFKPSYAKRNHIFEIEAILKSLDFIE